MFKEITFNNTKYENTKQITSTRFIENNIIINMITRRWILLKGNDSRNSKRIEKFYNKEKKKEEMFRHLNNSPQSHSLDVAYINVTYNCNLKCPFCYTKMEDYKRSGYLPLDQFDNLINNLLKYNTKSVCIIGGEPMLYNNLSRLVRSLRDVGIYDITVASNGTLLNDSSIGLLQENKIKLQISLDSISVNVNKLTRPNVNSDKLIEKILYLKNLGVNLKIMGTLTKGNIGYAFDMYKYFTLHEIAVGFFQFKDNGIMAKRQKPQLPEILTLLEKIYKYNKSDLFEIFNVVKIVDNMFFFKIGFPAVHCGAGLNAISITPDGSIYPCVKLTNNKLYMGNIFDRDIVLQTRLPFVENLPSCTQCDYKYFCGGGCRAEKFYLSEKYEKNSDCEIYIGLLKYFFSKIFEQSEKLLF